MKNYPSCYKNPLAFEMWILYFCVCWNKVLCVLENLIEPLEISAYPYLELIVLYNNDIDVL